MANQIDVLAVMDDAIEEYTSPRFTDRHGTGPELKKARAAVAELIEKAELVADRYDHGVMAIGPFIRELQAALARIGGSK